jgi:hypothetical protein
MVVIREGSAIVDARVHGVVYYRVGEKFNGGVEEIMNGFGEKVGYCSLVGLFKYSTLGVNIFGAVVVYGG